MEGLARRNQDVFCVFVNVDFRHQRVRGAKNTSLKHTVVHACTGMKVLRLTCSHSQNTITTVVEA